MLQIEKWWPICKLLLNILNTIEDGVLKIKCITYIKAWYNLYKQQSEMFKMPQYNFLLSNWTRSFVYLMRAIYYYTKKQLKNWQRLTSAALHQFLENNIKLGLYQKKHLASLSFRTSAPDPEACEWCSSPGEQQMVGLSKLSVHDRIEHGVDAAVEPGEVGTEHVQYLWGAVVLVGYIEQQEGDKTEDKTQENGEAHACHTLKFTIISWRRRWVRGGGCNGGRRSRWSWCRDVIARRLVSFRWIWGKVLFTGDLVCIFSYIHLAAHLTATCVGHTTLDTAVIGQLCWNSWFLSGWPAA